MRTFFKDVFGWGGLVAFLIVLASQSEPAHAYDNRDLHRLLTTNSCQNCDLRGLSLKRVRLRDADLRGSDLTGSSLYRVNLHGALLKGAIMEDVFMKRVNLQGADLSHADLDGAMILRSNLRHVNMQHASRQDAFIMPKGGWWHAFW